MLYVGGMFAAGVIGGMYIDHRNKTRALREFTKAVNSKWDILMDSLSKSQSENNIENTYKLLEIIPKHYGFLAIVKLPYGKDATELQGIRTRIEVVYGARVIVEPSSTDFKTCYMRIHIKGMDIDLRDNIKFKWYSHFTENKHRNKRGQTYRLYAAEDIMHQVDKRVVGTRFKVEIPSGLKYQDLRSEAIELSKVFGIVQIEYDSKSKITICEIIHEKLSDNEPFNVIKVKPWELFIGMEYNWNKVILDYSIVPNALVGGRQGSGKTVSVISAFINLCKCCSVEEMELYIMMIGEKQDLAIFRDTKFTKYYAQSEEKCIAVLNYLIKEMDRRNKLFANEKMCFNIFRYNKIVKKDKRLPIIHLLGDEIADLMESDKIQKQLVNLIRKARSAGIYVSFASQRLTKENINADVKAGLGNKICFKMQNSATAMGIVSGEDHVARVCSLEPNREFLVDYSEGVKVARTLCLTEDMMIDLMKDVTGDNKIKLGNTGEIIKEVKKEEVKKDKEVKEEVKKPKKESRYEKNKNKNKGGAF